MKFKKVILITLLLLTVFTISSVSASDNLTDEGILHDALCEEIELSEDANDEIVSSSQDDIIDLPDGTFEELEQNINNAAENSTIKLVKDYYSDDYCYEYGRSIDVLKSLTIDGQGHELKHIGFSLYCPVILKNISFIGEGVKISTNDSSIINCKFEGRYISGCGNNIKIINCSIIGLYGDYGMYVEGFNWYIKKCNFSGMIHINNYEDITSANTIIDCNFANIESSHYEGWGEVINSYYNMFNIINCNFENITGGAINGGENCHIEKCNFTNCYNEYEDYPVSTINMETGCIIDSCNFKNCFSNYGGAISGGGTILNSNFYNNIAKNGGAIYNYKNNLSIINCNFINNIANDGGAIYIYDEYYSSVLGTSCNVYITKSNFINNNAKIGGAISNYDCNLIMEDSTFNGNFAKSSDEIYGDADLINCSFAENKTPEINNSLITTVISSSINITSDNNANLLITLKDIDGNKLSGKPILTSLDNSKYYFTNENGQVSVPIHLSFGNNSIYFTFKGDEVYNASSNTANFQIYFKFDTDDTQNSNQTTKTPTETIPKTSATPNNAGDIKLTLTKVNVKKSAKKLVLQATLKKGNNALSGKKIIFKFDGKKYTVKTNKKGIAKVTIKKNVLKKLKVGKKVKYQASYGKTIVKKTVKVKK